eukprot:CAMPEP_0206582090 /NCGR_PEP_ID=MMETSP0325_2-20121206/34258_1 /ASSEMBLY_ACC=CAM_ASM_000347 /TAXON_ID=2866 /ORGANISM="Crypthecodinium cohnii, Strain Seligo" /LENGTH=462 /DNA_ID=CAMNT_0054088667 /DNA_START=69 /DNA_END=1453 /DNA_ORIENTATION=+
MARFCSLTLLALAALPAVLASGGHDDMYSFIQLESSPEVPHTVHAVEPPQLGTLPTGGPQAGAFRGTNTATNSLDHKPVTVVGANKTTAVKSHGAAKEQNLMVRQIFMLCVTMYGFIGLLWLVYWSKTKGTAAARTTQLAQAPTTANEQASPFYVGLLCASWASMSVGMHVMNKSLVSYLEAPALISAIQMIIAVVAMAFSAGSKFKDLPRSQLKSWMFVPLLFAGMLCSSFYAYAYISLSLLTVVRNLTPLVALPIETLVMPPERRPAVNASIILSIFIMLAGAIIYGDGILPTLSLIGLAFAFLNLSLAVTDRVLQRRLLTTECKDLPSDVCTVINNALGLIPTMLLAMGTHQFEELSSPTHKASWQDPQVWTLLILSGFIGIGICFLGFVCQRAISATSFFVLQNVSKVAVVSAGVFFFGDPIRSAAATGGLFLSLGGSFLYGGLQMRAGQAKPSGEAG